MKNDDEEMVKYIVNAIRCSLFWDESWYKKTYNISDDINALNHYIVEGYKMGYDPSPLFSGEKYYENNPDVKSEGINPLVHYELFGVEENRKYKVDTHEMLEFFKNKYPHLRMKLDGGIIRVRVTDKCNAKCRYCGLRVGVLGECHEHMNPDWYMRLFRPIYEKVDQVLLTGGDPFVCKESYSLMEMLGKEYPHLNVLVETNGMMLNEKYRALLSECLYTIHVSLNASNRKVFQESCWEGDGGEVFFDKVQENLKKYVALLESRDMLCFAPGYSMVINKDNYYDVIDFAKLALSLKGKYITYYFDYTENDMSASYFTNPEIMRPTLKKLMEIERVLARYILVTFRLWIPNKEAETIQKEVDEETDAELQKKYADLLEMAKDRSVEEEYEKRNEIRKKNGKRELSFEQDQVATLHLDEVCDKELCFSPWKMLDVYPNGNMAFCSWYRPVLNLKNFIDENKELDLDKVYNSYIFMRERNKIFNGNYDNCQSCCPLNDAKNPIVKAYEYGYGSLPDRKY